MDIEKYLRSLTDETAALKNRVRYLIEESHWLTDGEWKESVVRQAIRRCLPASIGVCRGFVVTADRSSTQLDVLICDSSKPALFRDGDLVFVAPDAVLGVIEVKSSTPPSKFKDAAAKLGENMRIVRSGTNHKAFAGIFSFEGGENSVAAYLEAVSEACPSYVNRLDFASIGPNRFIRYWQSAPTRTDAYEKWHSYELPQIAPGYFLHNVVESISPNSVTLNTDMWFLPGGKEVYKDGDIKAAWQINQVQSRTSEDGAPIH